MKTFPLVLLSAIALLFAQSGFAQSTQDALNDAQRAYIRGDTETAKAQFKIVLELDPHNVTAQNYMRMITMAEKANGGGAVQREKQLGALILPHVELNEATFGTALEYLKQSAAKQGVTDVSFVVQAPQEIVDTKKVTLNLSKIPFTEVMRYMGELTGFKFSIEKYAIVVKSQDAAPAVSSAAPVTPAVPAATP